MKNTSLFLVDESNFNLAPPSSPPPMIFVEEEEEEEEDYGDDDEGGVYYHESPEDVVDDDSDDVRLIAGLKAVNIEKGSQLLLGGECAVCLEEFPVEWYAKLPCSHIFQRHCIFPWL